MCIRDRNNSIVNVPTPVNEPIKNYKPNSPERESVLATYKALKDSTTDVKMWIGGKFIESSKTSSMSPPHDHKHILGKYYLAEKKHVEMAIESALDA